MTKSVILKQYEALGFDYGDNRLMEKVIELYNVESQKDDAFKLDVSFYVNRGDISALLGVHGSGKTYILDILTGNTDYQSGIIKIFGNDDISLEGPRIGYIPEKFIGINNLTVNQNLIFFSKVYRLNNKTELRKMYEEFQMDAYAKITIKNTSILVKKILGLMITLLGTPDLIIWDMPFDDLDSEEVEYIKYFIKKLNNEKKISFLLTGSEIGNYIDFSDSFIVVKEGKIIKQCTKESLDKIEKKGIEVYTQDIELAACELHKNNFEIDVIDKNRIIIYEKDISTPEIISMLVKKGVRLEEIKKITESKYYYLAKIMKGNV